MVGKTENIYIDLDKQNIIIVDPNKVVDEQNIIRERNIHQEDLVMYANLECKVQPRTRLAKTSTGINNDTISIAQINFLKPEENDYMGNGYLDEMTGKDSDIGSDVNSSQITLDKKTNRLYENINNKKYNNLLLINSIKISTKLDLYPQVTIVMEDIRGRALFEQGENSPYAAFFNLPYPQFTLTIKGYLGKAVKYELALLTFTSSFNTQTGNFTITTTWQTYKYGVLPQLLYNHVKVIPYMYSKTSVNSPTGNANFVSSEVTNGGTQNAPQQIYESFGGYETVQEVYQTYKSKGLIPTDFPEITVLELIHRLDTYEQYVQSYFGKLDLTPINQAEYYKKILQNYFEEVRGGSQINSWYGKWIDSKEYFITKSGQRVYPLKFTPELRNSYANFSNSAKTSLEVIIEKYNNKLSENSVFSENTMKIGSETVETRINNPINYETFAVDATIDDIDLEATWKSRGEAQGLDKIDFINRQNSTISNLSINNFQLYEFDTFRNIINNLQKEVEIKEQKIENLLTKEFSARITDSTNVLGFKPILRNVLAVLFANAEAFLRLLGKVHTSAWDLRMNPVRYNSILGNDKSFSPDGVRNVQLIGGELQPIYPWPHFYVEKPSGNKTQYVLEFPGNPDVISQTKGDDYTLWPEVAFVEEYLKSLSITKQTIQNKKDPITELINTQDYVNKYSSLALNFPTKNTIFSKKEVSNFLYEIYERAYVTAAYQRFTTPEAQNQILPVIANGEFLNIQNSIGEGAPYITTFIKNYGINAANIIPTLFNISNDGTGSNWQKYIRDIFVTQYLQNEVEDSFQILDESSVNSDINNVLPQPKNYTKFKNFITTDYKNSINMLDTYPFVLEDWYKNNMANGNGSSLDYLYNTAKVYDLHDTKKVVSNFNVTTSKREKRPLTSFNLYNSSKPSLTNTLFGFRNFYINRTLNDGYKNQQITEGTVSYYDYSGNISPVQSTSIFNTPYFVNAIQQGVNNWLSGETYPYVSAAYLFLNSLPLGTLREKYKTFTNGMNEPTDLDYIFATFKKYGAIHRIPYAWILKYGSIWHRYKKFITENVDILEPVWSDFDVVNNYDPTTNTVGKTYNLFVPGNIGTSQIVLEKTSPTTIGTVTQMNVGFYPKVINDYNLFFRGKSLFSAYTDSEIQSKIFSNDGFTLSNLFESSINKNQGYDTNNPLDTLSFKTWNCTLIDKNNKIEYIVPSFGSSLNQLNYECFNENGTMTIPLKSNYSVYNGSVRSFWSLPNYGYYSNNEIDIPTPYEYMKIIFSGSQYQEAFSLRGSRNYTEYSNGYTTIEEIFPVFTKKMLDIMETQFLLFSRSMYSYTQEIIDNTQTPKIKVDNFVSQSNSTYKNFQILMKEMMSINLVSSETGNGLFTVDTIGNQQFNKINSVIKGFMEFDVIVKMGNPGNFNRRLYDSFSTNKFIEDRITFPLYQQGTLPDSSTSGNTLNYFKTLNPLAWQALLLNVGFSTVDGIRYSNIGSTVTDFFIDNNIEFTEDSVQTCEPLIKSYATLKKVSPTFNGQKFKESINNHLNNNEKYYNNQIDMTMTETRQNLNAATPTKDSVFIGEQTKIELYESFKGLNDRWIAGWDYSDTTLFEDVLIIDRANRNISDEILFDPKLVKEKIEAYNYNPGVSFYAIIFDLLVSHNLYPMQHPAYVNYYNVHNVDDVQPILDDNMGDLLFGTYLDVDTKQSKPKLVCMYNWNGSEYLDIVNNKYASDSFFPWDNNVLDENINSDKKDWYFSNRVVGFTVDIGSQNQGVFKHFEVDQGNGNQTAESIQQQLIMYDQVNGQRVATQNNSLWNYYKARQYYCKVECLGAALIQPTMYFVVKYVPMFYGTYLIQEVTHNISPGRFDTSFVGARQSIFSYGAITNQLQLYTRRFFIDYKKDLVQNINTNKESNPTLNANPNSINNTPKDSKLSKNSQILPGPNTGNVTLSVNTQQALASVYQNFISASQNTTVTSAQDVADGIITSLVGPSTTFSTEPLQTTNVKNLTNTKVMSFVTCYMESYVQNEFKTYNNNFAGVKLDYTWPGNMSSFFQNEYVSRLDNNGLPYPYATFDDKQKIFDMLIAKWGPRSNTFTIEPESITKTWITQWAALSPYKKSMTDIEFENYKNTNQTQYQNILKRVTDGIELAKSLKLVNIYI